MREQPRIAADQLSTHLHDQYDLYPVTLEFLPRGRDYSAGVYRVVSERGAVYLLKVTLRPLYEPACLVPRYLNDLGITAVVAPLPTKTHTLWTKLGDWTVILYPFIVGDTSLTGMTQTQWQTAGNTFTQIHQAQLPPAGFPSLRQETFDPSVYCRWIHDFESEHLPHYLNGNDAVQMLCASWLAHQTTIQAGLTTLETLAAKLNEQALPYVLCHADLHAANLLRDDVGHVFVIDWDEVMLAPKERDFIFVRAPQAEAFFQGYGQIAIDWAALTYYRWERVIQDLIENAQHVCFRDDLGEESKRAIAQTFHSAWTMEGSNLAAAYAAASRLAA